MKAVRLKVEYLSNPIGIDIAAPHFFWNCEGGAMQTAYRITAIDSDTGELLWNSGKVVSDAMTHIPYGGKVLVSRTRVVWSVTLWDENDICDEAAESFFEIGLLNREDWKAKWISGDYKTERKKRYPVDCFRKSFSSVKKVKKARLYITACGLYEAKINGEKVGQFCLAPGHTDYRKRVQYQTYDVTDSIKNSNEIIVNLADGWYRGSVGAWGLTNQYGTETKLLAQLEITYSDGTHSLITTDESWQWSNDGAIRFADNKDGEIVDARRIPSFSGKAKINSHSVVPMASNNLIIAEKERFKAKLSITPQGKYLIDFGQNMAGYIEFCVYASAGQKLTVRMGEMLDKKGELTQNNIQCSTKSKTSPLQKIEYICRDGENHYKTTFAIFGFRYAEITTDIDITEDSITAIAVYSDMAQTGFFDCSDELLNRFVKATEWSAKSNSADVPTDCPTRERHGWTGDAQIFFGTAAYLFDYAAFSKKYLNDVYDWQMKSGRLPQIAPYGGVDFYMWTMNGSVGWSDIGIILPYRFYKIYGDKAILSDYYDRMKKYANFMMKRCGKTGLMAKPIGSFPSGLKKYLVNCGQSYGEWAEPESVQKMHWTDFAAPHTEVSTAYTAYCMKLMTEIADVLGKQSDKAEYETYANGCKKAYQALVKIEKFSLDTDRQAQLVRPLAFNLLNMEQTAYAKSRLIEALKHFDWCIGTGFLSTPLILDVLTDIDLNSAYKLLENKKMPGWLFMPKNGATTVWESWEGTQAQNGIASLNHYSKGAVCEWLFKTMCGINIVGKNTLVVSPKPGGSFSYAKAEYNSIYGKVVSLWRRDNGKTVYTITVPPNTSAQILLPGGINETVGAGIYTFSE